MRRILALVVLSALISASLGVGSPIGGAWAKYVDVPDVWTDTKTFRGGERATVMAVGENSPGASLTLAVYDPKGKLVAEDKGKEQPAGDVVAVIWYPPRNGDYRIEIRNSQGRVNRCYITIK